MGLKDKIETSKHLLTDDPSARTAPGDAWGRRP